MNALILANGDRPSRALLLRLCHDADLFIATDGAANWLVGDEICPHVVLGDFDSIRLDSREMIGECEFVHALDQEACDLDKAIEFARDRGADSLVVTGACGGRVDHSLTNVSVLLRHHPDVNIRIIEDALEMRLVSEIAQFRGQPGDRLSLICFGQVEGVTATGVRWPLDNERLLPGSRGVSNEFISDVATVSVRSGILVATHLKARS